MNDMRDFSLFLILSVLTASFSFCQDIDEESCLTELDSLTKTKIFIGLEQQPTVDGGMKELYKEVGRSMGISKNASRTESKVAVAFIVSADGTISGQRIINNITGTDAASQLLKIINGLKWNAGLCSGQLVPSIVILPMNICLK